MCDRTRGGTVLAMTTPKVQCTSKLPSAHGATPPQGAEIGNQAPSSTSSSGSVDRISAPPARTTTSSSIRTPPTPAL
jgi:hypothetical protein